MTKAQAKAVIVSKIKTAKSLIEEASKLADECGIGFECWVEGRTAGIEEEDLDNWNSSSYRC